MIGIVVSRDDPASVTIGKQLRSMADWETDEDDTLEPGEGGGTVFRREGFELRTFDRLHLELEGVASAFTAPEAVIFVSKHAGDTGPLLTAHIPGNVGRAAYGGNPNELPAAAPALLDRMVEELDRRAPNGFDVGIECTHHGPSDVGAPTLFVEVGSGPDEWEDPAPAGAVADSVLALEGTAPVEGRTIAGFGGGHYAPRFARVLRETGWHVGHIAADWALAEIDDPQVRDAVVEQVIGRSHAEVALIDGELPAIESAIEATGTRVVGETWLRETDGVPLSTVEDIEARLGSIADGTRIGARAISTPEVRRTDLPEQIVEAANGHDPAGAIEAVRSVVVALTTREGGNRLEPPVLVNPDTDVLDVLRALEPVLASRYDTVEITGDEVILRDRAFDPALATAKGVPEGPAFGRLADGESVTVDGERIDPEAVRRTEEWRIPVRRN